MRRPVVPLLLGLALLTGCGSDPSAVAEPAHSQAPASPAAPFSGTPAPTIQGLEVETGELKRDHKDGPLDYGAVPPVGGTHNPRWLACDVYDEPVPDEVAVHSLEHGAVWFTHAPDLPDDQVERLEGLAKQNREYVLVSPVERLAAPVVAVAWGVSLEVPDADDARLEAFLEQYAGGAQGGEPGAPCRGGGVSLREARGLVGGGTSA
jgi:hypothetical protein